MSWGPGCHDAAAWPSSGATQKLKAERAVAKSKVTRLVNVLDPILSKKGSEAKEEWDKVHDHATKLEEALLNLKRAHKKYAESLESEKGEEEIEAVANENNQYLTEAESPAYETLKKLKGYKDEVKKIDDHWKNSITVAMQFQSR